VHELDGAAITMLMAWGWKTTGIGRNTRVVALTRIVENSQNRLQRASPSLLAHDLYGGSAPETFLLMAESCVLTRWRQPSARRCMKGCRCCGRISSSSDAWLCESGGLGWPVIGFGWPVWRFVDRQVVMGREAKRLRGIEVSSGYDTTVSNGK
jgi:hypothetical protein